MFRKTALAIAATMLAASPAIAAPASVSTNPAKSLGLRASTPTRNVSKLEGDSGLVITALAVVAGIVTIVLVTDDDNKADSN